MIRIPTDHPEYKEPLTARKMEEGQGGDDEDGGWEYAFDFDYPWKPGKGFKDYVRRRRWRRERERVRAGAETVDTPHMFLARTQEMSMELRAHIYQGRDLISEDDNGASDPFCQVIFMSKQSTTHVIPETKCPTWAETVKIDSIKLWGTPEEIENAVPSCIVRLYDRDDFGDDDFLGQVIVKPTLRLTSDKHKDVPELKWHKVTRALPGGEGEEDAGELINLGARERLRR